ncbi:hypothetical protein CDL12_26402 [Handroanthus impetiginosus]|uniref:Uncharacterized protein n=1 Tax=Handroanthus impetiginosus TaxID=429701 RepID=A0A2G9G715_9LAMI|nr:hypothetical protein CDL12_26402 [Handroanthus impetiginosus]
MAEVDPEFIQAPEHRPRPEAIEAENIPLVDLSLSPPENLVAQIRNACENWGFFQRRKRKLSRDEVNPYGYYDTERAKNVRDWKEVFDSTVQHPTVIPASHELDDMELKELVNQWPEDLPELRLVVIVVLLIYSNLCIVIRIRIRIQLLMYMPEFDLIRDTL